VKEVGLSKTYTSSYVLLYDDVLYFEKGVTVFNATLNNISAISVLFVEETGVLWELRFSKF
jgi:hypothetical protein